MKKHKMKGPGDLPLNMTPMIDVVFNLIIFFMIIVDLSQQELEDITLPRASMCNDDDPGEADYRKIVNMTWDGEIVVKRVHMDLTMLENHLFNWRSSGLWEDEEGGFCPKPILIRTDRGTEMKHCQKVMQICGLENLKIYKVELACAKDAPGFRNYEDPKEVIPAGN